MIGDILREKKELLGSESEPEILTLTEGNGFVSQSSRFEKRVATEDTSKYKVVRRYDVAFNPYLLWAGAIAMNFSYSRAIISPVYPTFEVINGVHPGYANMLLTSMPIKKLFDQISFGSIPRRRRASVQDFLSLPLPPLPPLEEQVRISNLLNLSKSRLTNNRLLNSSLDLWGEALFSSTVAQHDAVQLIPLGKLGDISTGKTPPTSDSDNFGSDIPFVTPGDLTSGRQVGRYLSLQGKAFSRTAPKGSSLVCCIGTVGKVGIVREECAFNQQINAVKWGESVHPIYGYYAMRAKSEAMRRSATSTTIPILNKTSFKKLLIPILPYHLQMNFVRKIEKSHALRERLTLRSNLSSELYESVQYRAFRGHL
ncbi:restriction endonuclease subunit S [Kocuria sp. CPCC 205300]|uniref:restriction endonuclease subunit S n=1 Tax=Kocuria sabuli TaxID=3071448 RepID=UPI0036DB4139